MADFLPALHWSNLLIIPALLIGYTIHELAHALAAYALGDHTQVQRGKITLNPLAHISWLGSFFFLIIGAGWPKALRINPTHLNQPPYLDIFLIAIAGPAASFLMGLFGVTVTSMAVLVLLNNGATFEQAFQILLPVTPELLPDRFNFQATLLAFTYYMILANVWLTFMSLLPLPGQDGFIALISFVRYVRQPRQPQTPHPESDLPDPASASTPRAPSEPILPQNRLRHNAADIHFKIGVDYHQDQQYEDAVARYRQAIRNDQNFGPAYVNMALAYLARNERGKAINAFRGAIKYADEETAAAEAWNQLRLLSEVDPIDQEAAAASVQEMGATPWTDTKARPDWWSFGFSSGLLLISAIFLYGYLFTQVAGLL